MYSIRIRSLKQCELTENTQFSRLRYALIEYKKGSFVNSMPLIACRDYFNDIMYVQHSAEKSLKKMYGFKWKYSTKLSHQIKNGRVLMMITTDNDSMGMEAINKIEDKLGFSNTFIDYNVEVTSDNYSFMYKYSAVLSIPSEWFTGTFMLSYFTQLLRFAWYDGTSLEAQMRSADSDTECEDDFMEAMHSPRLETALINWEDIFGRGLHLFDKDAYSTYAGGTGFFADEHECCIHNGSGMLSVYRGIAQRNRFAEPAVRAYLSKLMDILNADEAKEAA